jgi:hypothetical protein
MQRFEKTFVESLNDVDGAIVATRRKWRICRVSVLLTTLMFAGVLFVGLTANEPESAWGALILGVMATQQLVIMANKARQLELLHTIKHFEVGHNPRMESDAATPSDGGASETE